jgi:hypothetical protein
MGVAAQTNFTNTNLREFAFTTNVILRDNIDHVFSHSPALAIFADKTLGDFGGVKLRGAGHATQVGGIDVSHRVRLGAHSGAKRGASGFDTHNVAPDDNTRLARANWRWYTHGLAISEHDLRVNRGDAAMASFLEDQTMSVMLALADIIADDIHATATAANGITPINVLIGNDDTVQLLDGGTYANYNSRGVSARGTSAGSISFASGSFAAQGLADMRTCYNNASEGMIQPECILTDYPTHERYEGALQPQERFAGAVSVADGSFAALAFKGKAVLADAKCTSGYLYMVRVSDGNNIKFRALEGADFSFGDWKASSNQNVRVRPLEVTCALTIGNRRYGNNKLTGITD